MSLVADSLPWTGSSLRSTATGFAATSVAVANFGYAAQSLPLPAVHPTGLPNCELLTSLEATALVLPSGGTASLVLTIPNDPTLAGIVLHHQFVQVELGAAGLASLSASNALTLTVGSF